nr:MAG TPA: hypothetical protein [Inoviridae sp.]
MLNNLSFFNSIICLEKGRLDFYKSFRLFKF